MTARSAPHAVLSDLDQTRGWQESFYQDVHQHPELSHQEHRTAAPSPSGCAMPGTT